jgi:hypothetical protein
MADQSRRTAEIEYLRVRELTRAAELALSQARNALVALQVGQLKVEDRMIEKTLPLFAEKLQTALVIRERRWNDDVAHRRYAITGLVVLAIFIAGFALKTWDDWELSGVLDSCLLHPLSYQGHVYCDLTELSPAVH